MDDVLLPSSTSLESFPFFSLLVGLLWLLLHRYHSPSLSRDEERGESSLPSLLAPLPPSPLSSSLLLISSTPFTLFPLYRVFSCTIPLYSECLNLERRLNHPLPLIFFPFPVHSVQMVSRRGIFHRGQQVDIVSLSLLLDTLSFLYP